MPLSLLMRPTVILALLLALSVGANVLLFKARDRALKHIGEVTAQFAQATAAGQACSAGVVTLKKDAEARAKLVREAVAAAEKRAREAALLAERTLMTAPSNPNDLCASAEALNAAKLAERRARPR